MRTRCFAALVGLAVMVSALPIASPATADSASCPDVELLYARGTAEDAALGPTGQVFADAMRARLADQSFQVYPVNYPASYEWATAIDGIRDTADRVIATANACPETKMVLSGFSQGAAVMGFVTSAQVPEGIDPETVPKPLQPEIAEHVSSVVLFGPPNARAMHFLGQPLFVVGPLYQAKTLELCIPDDPVCSDGLNMDIHYNNYPHDADIIDRGVEFAANHLGLDPAPAPHGPQLHAQP